MEDAWTCLAKIFGFCWDVWNYKITFGGITFTLVEVAAVTVVIFVIGVLLDVLLDGNWGA